MEGQMGITVGAGPWPPGRPRQVATPASLFLTCCYQSFAKTCGFYVTLREMPDISSLFFLTVSAGSTKPNTKKVLLVQHGCKNADFVLGWTRGMNPGSLVWTASVTAGKLLI